MFQRAVLHLDLDAFFVAVECLKDSALLHKPVIIGGGSSRAVVASCSYEARAFGIRAAMPVRMALQRCPEAILIRPDMEAYLRSSRLVTQVIQSEAPLFEKASIDEFYLDISGLDQHFGCWKWSLELQQKLLNETGLPISMGLAVNKLVSKVGTGEAKPNGRQLILAGTEKQFLAPLPVHKLPGVGAATYKKLSFMGVRDIQTLSRIPVQLLQQTFGKTGLQLWQKANAMDDSPVVPYREQQSVSTETTLNTDTTNVHLLRDTLTGMVSRLAFELRQKQQLTACVSVKLRYTDFSTYSKQQKIPHTASEQKLLQITHRLLGRVFTRRQLVRLVGVRFSGLVHGHAQIDLFHSTQNDERLNQAMDHLRTRFGKNSVVRASTLQQKPKK